PTIYCIGGVSGSGKTYLRECHNLLSKLPFIDIADVYADYPGIGREAARIELLDRLEQQLQEDAESSVCVEAFFAPGKAQRRCIEDLAAEYNVKVRFIWCAATRQKCLRRVWSDAQYEDYDRHLARVDFINEVPDRYFQTRMGEEEPYLVDGYCQECHDWPYEPPACCVCGCDMEAPVCFTCAVNSNLRFNCSARTCRQAMSGRRPRRHRPHYSGYY
ncbi:hypothetical protein Agub_g6587, partial [Astrephomene gubernaculifera]